ncbi:thioesterase family protein [Metallumcola ferriviriculae]|uniref:Thioesterase family protein n=1 Tax=Metallumcola ferriviriculae TaxID=3039180 RepID=A0AAU0UIV7_9FIRM|nr:thioesterase family protein [Desulfitibacteraceae bacterium MK1]
MSKLKVGLAGEAGETVTRDKTAQAYGSGQIEVYATPAMIGLMENAALSAVDHLLDEGKTTVGISISVKHLAATPVGFPVKAKASLKEIDGGRLVFAVDAYDSNKKIGTGEHQRFIVETERFLNKAKSLE